MKGHNFYLFVDMLILWNHHLLVDLKFFFIQDSMIPSQ